MVKCTACGGEGIIIILDSDDDADGYPVETSEFVTCIPCEGEGYIFGEMEVEFDAEAEHVATFGMNFDEWDKFTA